MEKREQREQIRRIREMEKKLNAALTAVRAMDKALEKYQKARADIRALEEYLTSPAWRADFAADEAGLLPPALRRGVLSEDGIPDLLDKNDEVKSTLLELAEEPARPF